MDVQPSPEVVAARTALDEEMRKQEEISPSFPVPYLPGQYEKKNPVYLAYLHQAHVVRMAKWTLYAAIDEHYEEMTGISTRNPPRERL